MFANLALYTDFEVTTLPRSAAVAELLAENARRSGASLIEDERISGQGEPKSLTCSRVS